MTFLDFYKREIGPANNPEHYKMLVQMSKDIEQDRLSKLWSFTLTDNRKLLAHSATSEITIVPELMKGDKVALVSALSPIKQLLVNNCNKVMKKEIQVDKTDDMFWILSL